MPDGEQALERGKLGNALNSRQMPGDQLPAPLDASRQILGTPVFSGGDALQRLDRDLGAAAAGDRGVQTEREELQRMNESDVTCFLGAAREIVQLPLDLGDEGELRAQFLGIESRALAQLDERCAATVQAMVDLRVEEPTHDAAAGDECHRDEGDRGVHGAEAQRRVHDDEQRARDAQSHVHREPEPCRSQLPHTPPPLAQRIREQDEHCRAAGNADPVPEVGARGEPVRACDGAGEGDETDQRDQSDRISTRSVGTAPARRRPGRSHGIVRRRRCRQCHHGHAHRIGRYGVDGQ